MQPGVTVALAIVWLAGLVGVLSTSTPPPPFVDQYSPQLPENRHGVGRRPEVLANRKLWRTLQDRTEAPIHANSNELSVQKFAPTESPLASFRNETLDDYRDELLKSPNSVVYIEKTAELNTKVNEKKSEASQSRFGKKSVNVIEKTSTTEVPELRIDLTGERKKRSVKLSSLENRYFVPDADPLVAIEFGTEEEDEDEDGQYYEEIDELLRLRQEEKTRGQSKVEQTRGDIPVTEEDSSGTSDVPLRGDIGVANARAIADSSRLVEATKKPRSIETSGASASFIDVTASNGSRRIAKRETIDFSRKMKSSWGYAEKGADPSARRKKPKGDNHKKKNDTIKNLKRNQNNRRKLDNRSQKKNLMGSRDSYRTRPSAEEEALLEKKLQDYIRRNTPIDVRRNRHLYSSFNYDHRRRDDNRDFYPNANNRRTQVPDDNQPRDQWGREISRGRHEPQQRHDPRQIHDARHHDPRLNHDPNISQGTQQNYDPSVPHDPRYTHRQRPSHDPRQYRGSTEGHIERTPLKNNISQPNYEQALNHNTRHHHDPRYHVQHPRQRNDPRQNYDQRQRNDPRLNYRPHQSSHGLDRNVDNNRSTPPAENVRRLSTPDNNGVDDYVRRNTPVDVRHQPNRGLVRPYQTGVDTRHSVSDSAPAKPIYEQNKPRTEPPFLTPVDRDSHRYHSFKAANVTLDDRQRNRAYDQQPYKQPSQNEHQDRWRHPEFLGYEQGPEISQSGTPEHETRYQEFRGNAGYINTADYDRYRHAQVGARIYITPSVFQNRFKRDVDYARIDPHHKGPVAARFPVPATKKPPVEGPSLCVWAVIKCCSNSARRSNCFEAVGCPQISWDPNPCRKAVIDAAANEIRQFYIMSEDVY